MAIIKTDLATSLTQAMFSNPREGGPIGRVWVVNTAGGTGWVLWSGAGAGDSDTWQWVIALDYNYSYLLESCVVQVQQSAEASLAAAYDPWLQINAIRGLPRSYEWTAPLRRVNSGAVSITGNAGTEVGASNSALTSIANTWSAWTLDVTARPPAPIQTLLPGTGLQTQPEIAIKQGCSLAAPGGTWGAQLFTSFLMFDRQTAENL